MNNFRTVIETKYKLMPYIYAESKNASEKGLPMMRALFIEFPDDAGAWQIDNQYMFGSDILVAPLFEQDSKSRQVYLPKGQWIDYQTGKSYNTGWHTIEGGALSVVMMVRDGAVLPHLKVAQSTKDLDWTNIELIPYSANSTSLRGKICLPSDNVLHTLTLSKKGSKFVLDKNPLANVKFTVK
jgi:alpha-D-xyloside xylohydrolase